MQFTVFKLDLEKHERAAKIFDKLKGVAHKKFMKLRSKPQCNSTFHMQAEEKPCSPFAAF